jgi:transposase
VSIVSEVVRQWKRLSKPARDFLNREAMTGRNAEFRMRCKIIRNLARGETPMQIHRILGCSRSQVYRMSHRFVKNGIVGLVDQREENGPTKVLEEYASEVLAAVAGSPREHGYDRPTWTQELLILVVRKKTSVGISRTTMCRLLQRLNVRNGRPKPYVMCPWPQRRKSRRLNDIKRLEKKLPRHHVMLYVDEVDIHLNPKIGNDWMLKGQQKQVLTPGQNEKWYLAGALDHQSGRLHWVEGTSKNSALFISLVDDLVQKRYRNKKVIHLVLDNFKIHSSKAVQAASDRWGKRVQFHFLPPYCPDANRIERRWKDLHDNVTRNHTCRSMDELIECVRRYLSIRRRTGKHGYCAAA